MATGFSYSPEKSLRKRYMSPGSPSGGYGGGQHKRRDVIAATDAVAEKVFNEHMKKRGLAMCMEGDEIYSTLGGR